MIALQKVWTWIEIIDKPEAIPYIQPHLVGTRIDVCLFVFIDITLDFLIWLLATNMQKKIYLLGSTEQGNRSSQSKLITDYA